MARHRRAIGHFRDQLMNGFTTTSRPRSGAMPAILDPAALAALRDERDRDVRLVVVVLAAALVAGLSVLVHSLS